MTKITTIRINNDTSNPIAVEVSIRGQKENGSWYYEINEITSVELVISDSYGIDITKQVLSSNTATSLIESQVNNEQDQIIDALSESEEVEQRSPLFEMCAGIVRSHAKAFYGIDLNGGSK